MALVEPMAPARQPIEPARGTVLCTCARASSSPASASSSTHGPAVFSVVNRDGVAHNVTVEPIAAADDVIWTNALPMVLPPRDVMWLHDSTETRLVALLEDTKTLYLQYNEVVATGSVAQRVPRTGRAGWGRPVVSTCATTAAATTTAMRGTRGPSRSLDRPGRGASSPLRRLTFSARNFATEVEATTGASSSRGDGHSPNLYGDVRRSSLPTVRLDVYIASVYWQKSTADDPPDHDRARSRRSVLVGRLLQ